MTAELKERDLFDAGSITNREPTHAVEWENRADAIFVQQAVFPVESKFLSGQKTPREWKSNYATPCSFRRFPGFQKGAPCISTSSFHHP
jgi:hypothetical protein